MATLRQYVTEDEVQEITGRIVHESSIAIAEADIDSATAIFYHSYLQPFLFENILDTVTVSGSTVTLPRSYPSYYFTHCCVQFIDSNEKQKYPVRSSENNTITLWDTLLLTGSQRVRITQAGKYPMLKDWVLGENNLGYKEVTQAIKEATAWQSAYIQTQIDDDVDLNETPVKSESIGTNYSYTSGTNTDIESQAVNRLSVKAYNILQSTGYTFQTI
jgi:hypothetical protein